MRSVVTRAVMELFLLGPDVYADPSVQPAMTHLTHRLLPSPTTARWGLDTAGLNAGRGWGWNFFLFFHRLLERYAGEGMGDEGYGRFVQLGLQRQLVRDYRLAVFAMAGEGAGSESEDVGEWGQGWWWPREDSMEVLTCYRDYVARKGGDRRRGGPLLLVAMHHLLCSWFGEEAVRENREVEGKEAQVRQRLGVVNESVIHALCQYRFYVQ